MRRREPLGMSAVKDQRAKVRIHLIYFLAPQKGRCMKLLELPHHLRLFTNRNSNAVLTSIGISGIASTAYLSWKAGYKVAKENPDWEALHWKERTRRVWKIHIPVVASGAMAVGCVVASSRIEARRAAAASAAYAVAEHSFEEYRRKVVEQIGERKEQTLRDELAQERVNQAPSTVVFGSGSVLCREDFTGRYFQSDKETLRKAENDVNARLHRDDCAVLDDFYYAVKLPYTSESGYLGWTVDRPLELTFSTALHEGVPCLTFSYNYIERR